MLHAPEAAGGDGALLRGVGDGDGGAAAFGTETHLRGGGEGAEEAGDEVGCEARHDCEEGDGEDEGLLGGELQFVEDGVSECKLYVCWEK